MRGRIILTAIFILTTLIEVRADMMVFDKAPQTTLQPIVISHSKSALNNNQRLQLDDIDDEDTIYDNSSSEMKRNVKYADFLNSVSGSYRINKNKLGLSRIQPGRRKQSIMFVFLMNDNKIVDKNSAEVVEIKKDSNKRVPMHVLMPGRRIMKEQKVVKDEYPIDFSVANYEDGFATHEWNLVLPNKKPKEIDIALMWSF